MDKKEYCDCNIPTHNGFGPLCYKCGGNVFKPLTKEQTKDMKALLKIWGKQEEVDGKTICFINRLHPGGTRRNEETN